MFRKKGGIGPRSLFFRQKPRGFVREQETDAGVAAIAGEQWLRHETAR